MNQREVSRKEWETGIETPSLERINSGALYGALQRIAAACELMGKNWITMQAENRNLKADVEYYKKHVEISERSISALRGVITKLKRRQS
jgi:hypothetical protein